MKNTTVVLFAAGLASVMLGQVAFAQTATVPPASVTNDVETQLGVLTVQIQGLAVTPIVTGADESQALLIIQSITRAVAGLNDELNTVALAAPAMMPLPADGTNASADVASRGITAASSL